MHTSDNQFRPTVGNQGWRNDIAYPNTDLNDNYFAGATDFGAGGLRSFFTFDFRSVDLTGQTLVSALLQLRRGTGGGDPTETITLRQVTTDAAALNSNEGVDAAILDDLGDGPSYGPFTLNTAGGSPEELPTLPLNAEAIADITAAADGFYSMGGSLDTLSDRYWEEFLFGSNWARVSSAWSSRSIPTQTRTAAASVTRVNHRPTIASRRRSP